MAMPPGIISRSGIKIILSIMYGIWGCVCPLLHTSLSISIRKKLKFPKRSCGVWASYNLWRKSQTQRNATASIAWKTCWKRFRYSSTEYRGGLRFGKSRGKKNLNYGRSNGEKKNSMNGKSNSKITLPHDKRKHIFISVSENQRGRNRKVYEDNRGSRPKTYFKSTGKFGKTARQKRTGSPALKCYFRHPFIGARFWNALQKLDKLLKRISKY